MIIYNTLTKKKEEFHPLNPPNVSMYMCGPTVYNYFHIGNARSFIMADIFRRYLEHKGYDVNFVMNLTDIDDNIIKKSIEEKNSTDQVARFYSDAFFNDIKRLKLKPANVYPKATDHISEMIEVIKNLENKGIAYNVNGNVFFNVLKFQNYGRLSGKNLDELEVGARVDVDETKKSPLDFALWKKAKIGEPSWDSPWGKGRPGWHIECSAMSTKHLGKTIDIHAGGNDLIFPHHENEIAQSEAAFEQKFVRYWMHFGFLNFRNEKMSKSLGNFFTARDVLSRFSVETIRLFFSQTHYRGPLNFSEELLEAAEKGVEKVKNLAQKVNAEIIKNVQNGIIPDIDLQQFYDEFNKVMDDDFNSPQGIAVIYNLIRQVNTILSETTNLNVSFLLSIKHFLQTTAQDILGIIHFDSLESDSKTIMDDKLIELLINLRNTLKYEKKFDLADFIRNELNKLGILLEDNKLGTTYKRRL